MGRRLFVGVLAALLAASSCTSSAEEPTADPFDRVQRTTVPDDLGWEAAPSILAQEADDLEAATLRVVLTEGQVVQPARVETIETVVGSPLSKEAAADVFDRVTAMAEDPADLLEYNRPPETLNPPLDRPLVIGQFPLPQSELERPDPSKDPLKVVRFQPEGDVSLAPFASITFNQPMVPISTVDQLEALDVPVTMAPELPGQWKWIGTRTLRFEHDPELLDRLPMATAYTVDVPAGIKSQSGQVLQKGVVQNFATPAVELRDFGPRSDIDLEPVFVFSFSGRVDPEAVLSVTTMEDADNGVPIGLRLATDEEIESDPYASREFAGSLNDRRMAFKAVDPLAKATTYKFTVGPDVPSLEGPLTKPAVYTPLVSTYGPLLVEKATCGWDDCRPLDPFRFNFTNSLDLDAFDPLMVAVTPEPAGLRVDAYGGIVIAGETKGKTSYKVVLSPQITDLFGQKLEGPLVFEFRTGSARPVLAGFEQSLITADPFDPTPAVTVGTLNHDRLQVTLFKVEPSDYEKFREYERSLSSDDPIAPPGREVSSMTVDVDGDDDSFAQTRVMLGDALDENSGQIVVLAEGHGRLGRLNRDHKDYWNNRPRAVWVQATDLGLDTFTDKDRHVVWVTDLKSGEPVEGVEVEFVGGERAVLTDSNGVASVPNEGAIERVVATLGEDLAFLHDGHRSSWSVAASDSDRWYVFDDRGIYKPGENVRVKGWTRRVTGATDTQIELPATGTISFTLIDSRGVELATGSTTTSEQSGFDLDFDIPAGANLGSAQLQLRNSSGSWTHQFQIQEFRTPEFEVATRLDKPAPHFANDSVQAIVEANYFAGGALPNAEVAWSVSTRSAYFTPPNWSGYSFGSWNPWWFDGSADSDFVGDFSGRTDAAGSHALQLDLGGQPTEPIVVVATAGVLDVNRQQISSSESILVHPARNYVGLRSLEYFVQRGEDLDVDVIVTDIDGKPVVGRPVAVEAARIDWRYRDGDWLEGTTDGANCALTSTAVAQTCTFTPSEGGQYRIAATVTDVHGASQTTVIHRWVSGRSSLPGPLRVEREEALVIPDRQFYGPGDTAEILVQSPFSPAHGLLIVERNGITSEESFQISDGTAQLSVDLRDSDIPNVTARVELVGAADRDPGAAAGEVPKRPAYAAGSVLLSIPPTSRELTVEAIPRDSMLNPGGTTTVDLLITDADARPVGDAELAVVVVDEAVLSLTNYELRNPLDVFYETVQPNVRSVHGRQSIVLTDPEALIQQIVDAASSSDGDALGNESAAAAPESEFAGDDGEATRKSGNALIEVRKNFDALAVFAPEVLTDAEGRASVEVPLPDNLTRYRIMVVAVNDADRFGAGEASITASLPLMVRPSAPRFANFGDEFEFPVVLQNLTDTPLDVDVAMRATNLELTGPNAKLVTVPANDRIEVRFPVAVDQVGTARFQVAAVSGGMADAAQGSLPVYTPSTTEAFATYGVVDDGAVLHTVDRVEDVFPQFGGLEITTSSTAVQALTDSVIYLSDYPYRSSDAYASRIIAIASLRDVLGAFESAQLPEASELNAQVQRDIDGLLTLQNQGNGGFYSYSRSDEVSAYRSVQATHALVVAKQNGYDVDEAGLAMALRFLATIEFQAEQLSAGVGGSLLAYALHVRNLAGNRDEAKAEDTLSRYGESLQPDALAWLWPVVGESSAESIRIRINDATTETAGAATFVTSYAESDSYLILHSSRRADGVVLDGLITMDPESDLIPKVVRGLMAGQKQGRWNNVQENSFILLALNNYFDTFEAVTPDFVAQAWLGSDYVVEHEYRRRTTKTTLSTVPMELLTGPDVGTDGSDLILSKAGDGRLYYRLGLRYAPTNLELKPRDQGFVVTRRYEAIDDPTDVTRNAEGDWVVKAGANVRVQLTMVADSRRTDVALVDPLPAGFEALNPELATSGLPPADTAPNRLSDWERWGWFNWYSFQNLRDGRAEVISSYLWAGSFDFSYIALATTPGTFVVPPAKAEEIYSPEVFGRSASERVIIVD